MPLYKNSRWKDILSSSLSELEPIRKIKSRTIERLVARMLKSSVEYITYYPLQEASANFDSLSSRCTFALDISEWLTRLQKEAKSSLIICLASGHLERLAVWNAVCDKWWFDESYLCEKLDKIVEFYQVIEEYSNLPRSRGSGHAIEAWVKNSDIETKYIDAQAQFDAILAGGESDYGFE